MESPADFGLIDDGSISEVMIYNVQQGRIAEIVEVFQETFADFRPQGFKIAFAAADVANNRLIWVHRYEKGFDLTKRFYLGKYPKLAHCLWSGTRYDALEASPEELDSGPEAKRFSRIEPVRRRQVSDATVKTLEQLKDGLTVELKIYQVKDGGWSKFLHYWRKIVRLRKAAGFNVEFAVADMPGRRFVWAVSLDGDFSAGNIDYLSGDDRIAANVISDYIEMFEIPKVVHIPVD
jgi:hypothetical protein